MEIHKVLNWIGNLLLQHITVILILSSKALAYKQGLQFSHIVFRHGDRTPYLGHSIGPNASDYWPEGYGELTTLGMNQSYHLGLYLRKHYDGFISQIYNSTEIYVRSTDFNRTLMTAEAVMTGFYYPPFPNQTFTLDIPWFPVPIHTIAKNYDSVLWMDCPCPTVENMYYGSDGYENSSQPRAIMNKYQGFITYLKNKTGIKIDYLDDMWSVADAFYTQAAHPDTHPLPDWALNKTVFDTVMYLYDQSLTFYYSILPIQRLRGGPLLEEIVNRMVAHSNSSINKEDLRPRHLMAYSAHETTIIALLENLGAFNNRNPPYASVLMIDLIRNDGEFYVELSYRNETDHEPYSLEIANCSSPCTLQTFVERSKQFIPSDWAKECGFVVPTANKSDSKTGYIAAIAVMAIVIGILFLAVIILAVRSHRDKRRHW